MVRGDRYADELRHRLHLRLHRHLHRRARFALGQRVRVSPGDLLQGEAQPAELRRFITAMPYLDHSDLEPAAKAIAAIRQSVADLKLAETDRVKVRVTGPAPIADEEQAAVEDPEARRARHRRRLARARPTRQSG